MVNKKYSICPSVLAADCLNIGRDVQTALSAGADRIHIDIMDNHYVPNLSFGPTLVEAIKKQGFKVPLDVHLMVTPVDRLIIDFANAGATQIYIHPEATLHLDRSVDLIRSRSCKVGIVLNPASSPELIHYVLDKIDTVLVMSVNPGFGGQKFMPSILPKIKILSDIIERQSRDITIEVDGGINLDNIKDVANAGATSFVMGSSIFGSPDIHQTIVECRKILG